MHTHQDGGAPADAGAPGGYGNDPGAFDGQGSCFSRRPFCFPKIMFLGICFERARVGMWVLCARHVVGGSVVRWKKGCRWVDGMGRGA